MAISLTVKKAIKRVVPKSVRVKLRQVTGISASGPATDGIPWHDAAKFPFTKVLEDNWKEIRAELDVLEAKQFENWPVEIYDGQWDVFGLYSVGNKVEENCALCPVTTRVIEQIPRLSTAAFSALEPGTHIRPHVGWSPTVLRCHLGLKIPENCSIRVGQETRIWEEGKCIVFDDMFEHEAWNNAGTVRVVLLLDFVKEGVAFDPTVSKDAKKLVYS